MARRIIAQQILTGGFFTWDVPLTDATATRELSGPGGIVGSLSHAQDRLMANGQPLLQEWQTALYYEADGQIRSAGIVTRLSEGEDGALHVEAPGFSTYPHGIPYLGDYQPGLGADPLDVIREIWNHVQSYANGDLGVTVDPTTSGAVLDDVRYDQNGVETSRQPYRLSWWDNADCGNEIDKMLTAAPADYIETHTWNADHTAVEHNIHLGVPTLGNRRDDLRFALGENIIKTVPLIEDGENFAQNVLALGKGEGREMARSLVTGSDNRLRRVAVVTDKSAGQTEIDQLATDAQARHSDLDAIKQIVVRDHPNAPLAAIEPGDDIFVQTNLRWFGRKRMWCRVVAIHEPLAGGEVAAIDLTHSDQN